MLTRYDNLSVDHLRFGIKLLNRFRQPTTHGHLWKSVGLLTMPFRDPIGFVVNTLPQWLEGREPCLRSPRSAASRNRANWPPTCVHISCSIHFSQYPSSISSPTIMDAFEIAWFSSAFVFAYWVYAYEPLEPSKRPKKRPEDSLIPIKAKGEDICVPPAFVDATCDLSEFATQFDLALKKAVPELKLSSGTLWTARIVRGKKPEVEKALRGMDEYVVFSSKGMGC